MRRWNLGPGIFGDESMFAYAVAVPGLVARDFSVHEVRLALDWYISQQDPRFDDRIAAIRAQYGH